MDRITKEEFLEYIFKDDYQSLKGRTLRMTRVRIPGRELMLAHVITPNDPVIYQNLGLHIGTHAGEDHTGEAVGLMRMTPWEVTVAAADIAIKAADVELAFLDRFNGTVILTGKLTQVITSLEEVVRVFRDELGFPVCEVTKK